MSVLIGIGLSAACGFRIFVPLFIASIAAKTGHLQLAMGYEWMGSWPTLLALGVATGCEIAAYYVPWIDHLMDMIASPAAVGAGMLVAASTMVDVPPYAKWALVIIGGGGAAATTQFASVNLRLLSSACTGGIGNPIVSTIEAVGATVVSILTIFIPIVALLFMLMVGIILYRIFGSSRIYDVRHGNQ